MRVSRPAIMPRLYWAILVGGALTVVLVAAPAFRVFGADSYVTLLAAALVSMQLPFVAHVAGRSLWIPGRTKLAIAGIAGGVLTVCSVAQAVAAERAITQRGLLDDHVPPGAAGLLCLLLGLALFAGMVFAAHVSGRPRSAVVAESASNDGDAPEA